MQNLTKSTKLFLFITMLFFALWIGGYVLRHMVIYQLFEPENPSLKINYTSKILPDILYIIFPIFVFNIVSYAVFIISFLVFIFISKISLKREGWLLISCIVIAICAPFEIYLLTKDYEIARVINSQDFNPLIVINLIHERLVVLSSFSLIEIMSSVGIIFLCVFQPLKKS